MSELQFILDKAYHTESIPTYSELDEPTDDMDSQSMSLTIVVPFLVGSTIKVRSLTFESLR